jgi:carbonic anhydrase/acetyltransferase-like protein (isoleucine patch superfamily)
MKTLLLALEITGCGANGCIISVSAIIDHDAGVSDYCHINAGAIIKAGGKVESESRIDAGQIVRGYPQSGLKPADSNNPFTKEYYEQTGKEVSFF